MAPYKFGTDCERSEKDSFERRERRHTCTLWSTVETLSCRSQKGYRLLRDLQTECVKTFQTKLVVLFDYYTVDESNISSRKQIWSPMRTA